MAKIVFDVEIANDLDGSCMNFEYEYDIDPSLTEEEAQEIADEISRGHSADFYDEVLSWFVLNASVSRIEMDD